MTEKLGFSYVGALFLIMLLVPNFVFVKNKPRGYSTDGENRVLLLLERVGEVMTTVCALCFKSFNPHGPSLRGVLLALAFAGMILYEIWWIRYSRSGRELKDFYSGLWGIPLAGATLPVAAFILLGLYGDVPLMLISAAVLGVGHIGIHMGHKAEADREAEGENS